MIPRFLCVAVPAIRETFNSLDLYYFILKITCRTNFGK